MVQMMAKNTSVISVFEKTPFYQEAIKAIAYTDKNQKLLKDSMQVIVYKELLLIRLEIDLNFLDLATNCIEMLGFTLEEPLTINLTVDQNVSLLFYILQRLINIDMKNSSLKDLIMLNFFTFECHQGAK
jgi:hypothetical protein